MARKLEIILTNGKQLVLSAAEVKLVDTVSKCEKALDDIDPAVDHRVVNWRNVATIQVRDEPDSM